MKIEYIAEKIISSIPAKDRDKEIYRSYTVKGIPIINISKKHNISRSRTAQIVDKCDRMVRHRLHLLDDSNILELREKGYLDKDTIMRFPISNFDLSVRTRFALMDAKVKTIGDIVKHSEKDLLKMRNFGSKSLKEITDFLDNFDIKLRKDNRSIYTRIEINGDIYSGILRKDGGKHEYKSLD